MKKQFLVFLSLIILSSCKVNTYFQVYKASPTDKYEFKNNQIIFEDENCIISYNLWDDGGNFGFRLLNKSDKNIYLNMDECFFILNGFAYNYFKNRIYSTSTSSGVTTSKGASASRSIAGVNNAGLLQANKFSVSSSVGVITSSGYSVSYNEEKIVCIPAKTSKYISEYKINQSYLRDCDLLKYPNKRNINSKKFTKSESPLIFSNLIAYKIGQSDNLLRFETNFFISEISNCPSNLMYEKKFEEVCDEKSSIKESFFKDYSADKFYIKYTRDVSGWKH